MTIFKGKGVYSAIAIGKISIFKRQELSVIRYHITDTSKEKQRVSEAKELAKSQLSDIYEKAVREVGETDAG